LEGDRHGPTMPSRGLEKQFLERGFRGEGSLCHAARFFSAAWPVSGCRNAPPEPGPQRLPRFKEAGFFGSLCG
jgi:hypothetical protein